MKITDKKADGTGKQEIPPLISLTHLVAPGGLLHRAGLHHDQITGTTARNPRILGLHSTVYIVQGTGWFGQAKERRRRVTAGDLLHVFPEIPHYYHPPEGTSWSEFHVIYGGETFDALSGVGILSRKYPVWHLEPVDYWLEKMYAIVDPRIHPPGHIVSAATGVRLVARWQEFLADAFDAWMEAQSGLRKADHLWLHAAEMELYPGPSPLPSPARVARQMGMSSDSFRRKFHHLKNISPSAYQQRRRIHEACEMLAAGSCSVKEAADRLGFVDAFHLSKQFKRIMGIAPRNFICQLASGPVR